MTDDDICGSTDTASGEPCQRTAGWGRDEDSGPCIDHSEDDGGTGNRTELEKNPPITDLVAGELQSGATVPEACAEAKISTSAYHRYRDRGNPYTNDDPPELFREFWEETERARKRDSRMKRDELWERALETGDTRTAYKLLHDQHGDTFAEEGGDGDAADGIPLVVPDSARPDP